MTESTKNTKNIAVFRYKTYLLLGSISINIGDYSKALNAFSNSEKEILENFDQPELNLKLASVYLNLGIGYIYLNNFNIAERFIKKGQAQVEGMLGNDIVYKVIKFKINIYGYKIYFSVNS